MKAGTLVRRTSDGRFGIVLPEQWWFTIVLPDQRWHDYVAIEWLDNAGVCTTSWEPLKNIQSREERVSEGV